MNVLMIVIMVLLAVTALAGVAAALRLGVNRQRVADGPLWRKLRDNGGFGRLSAVPLMAWMFLYFLILVLLLVVSGVALLYVFALFHGEWFQLLDSLPKTAGNVVVHLIYPLQMTLFAFLCFYLAVGGAQLVLGPVEKLRRMRLCVDEFSDFARRLAGVLALVMGLEVVKILSYSLLAAPDRLGEFFARETMPKADPLIAALLVAAVIIGVAAWWRRGRSEP
ncbi:MAG: hypothetical protein P9L99_15170 [Candidatus Lernaella stagnicola]|nr:hypothetical protein [Candidatus Lernaella stagnicola]